MRRIFIGVFPTAQPGDKEYRVICAGDIDLCYYRPTPDLPEGWENPREITAFFGVGRKAYQNRIQVFSSREAAVEEAAVLYEKLSSEVEFGINILRFQQTMRQYMQAGASLVYPGETEEPHRKVVQE